MLQDEELARRAKEGCTRSFGELVRRYQVPIYHFLQRKCGLKHEAEDLTQETFLRAFKKLWSFDEEAEFRPWIYTVAYRMALNFLRRRQCQSLQDKDIPSVVAGPSGPELDALEERSRLWDMVHTVLTPIQFTVVWLFYVEQMSAREIGLVVEKSECAVKTILCRARKVLIPHLRAFAIGRETREKELPGSSSKNWVVPLS